MNSGRGPEFFRIPWMAILTMPLIPMAFSICFWVFFPYKCYHDKGSDDTLGMGSSVTTLRNENPDLSSMKRVGCPQASE